MGLGGLALGACSYATHSHCFWYPGPGYRTCVKTQKRPRVVPFKLDWISDEVGLCWKEVIGSEASQMPDSLRLILTSTITFF